MNKKWILIIILVFGVLSLITLFYLLLQPPKKKEQTREQSLRQRFSDFFLSEDKPLFLSPEEIEKLIKEKGLEDEVLNEIYKDYLRYPPDSRPLYKEMVDLIDPWKIEDQPLPVIINPKYKNETEMKKFIDEMMTQ